MRFGILGPLEVRAGEELLTFGPRVQAVLATLLLADGKEISADALIDVVWGDSPPPTARTSLQVHISRLRRTLGAHGLQDALVTRGSSYALTLARGQLDAEGFRRLIEEGRRSLASGDASAARDVFVDALELWRGPPLAGLELPGLAPGTLRELEDQHDLAVMLRLEAELALGHHADVVPELARLRKDQPLDERVAELTALALYRSGRQADALAELAGLRHQLSEQLGTDPGLAIAELERRILAGDPTLAAPAVQPAAAREVRKTVTVVALRLPAGDPEEVRAATAAISDLFGGVVANLGGWSPPAGSGRLLAVFGVPAAREDDAERAVKTADALGRAAAAMGAQVRLGVATGEVLVEIGGDEVRLLTHEPVEVADQLARKGRGGEVLLGLATHRLTRAIAEVEPAPVLILDDETPLVAYRLLNVADTRAAPRLSAPLVGRDPELRRLRVGVDRALTERRPTLLTVLGAAGIGKSRLIAEFVAGLGDRVDVAIGRCLPYGRDIGMWPVAEIVRTIAGISEDDGVRSALRRLHGSLAYEPDGEVLVDQLGALLGLSDRSPAPDETSWAIRRFLEIAAGRRPLVVGIEDLQWADDSLLDLLGYVSSTAKHVPVAFVCSARPELVERRPTWGGPGADSETIRLEPLPPPDTDDLLVRLLGTSELEQATRERIASAAEGNPLFLEEIVSILIDDGHLREREGRWEPSGDLSTVPLPPTVRALLEGRVDRLAPTERDVVEAAAIVGREFRDEDLEDLRPDADAAEVASALESLGRRDFLQLQRFSRPGSRLYAFRHILMRDVVYQAIPKEVRADDHERLGRALIERAGDRLAEIQDIVGYHLETAFHLRRQLERGRDGAVALGRLAATHLGAAGRRAFGRDDLAAAASLFGRALACASEDDPMRGELARLRGGALFDLGRFSESEEALREGFEVAERASDEALRWRLELERAHVDTYLRPDDRAGSDVASFAREAMEALERLGDIGGLARAHRLLAEALLLQGRQEEANEAFRTGWELAQRAGDERELAMRQHLTGLHGPTPLPAFIGQCAQLLQDAIRSRPETLLRLAFAEALVGRNEDARRRIAEGLAHARDIGGAFRVADAEVHAGAAFLWMDDPSSASVHLRLAVDGLAEIGERSVRATAAALLGEAWWRLGYNEEAAAAAELSRELAADDDQAAQMGWRQVQAKVLVVRGELPAARELAAEATRIADETDFLTMTALAHADAAYVASAAGDEESARRERDLALELAGRKGASTRIVEPKVAASIER
jgi:DNA-binding SARP family transcriptional activator/tetratricopeptide (TPR) repeat protein